MLTTTFELLHKAEACAPRYKHLAHALGGIKAYGRQTHIPLLAILDHNGLDDALWALRAVPVEQVEAAGAAWNAFCYAARFAAREAQANILREMLEAS